ncbi:MAG: cytochrome c biogenesis protein CcsA [Armatimonadetes bacterium]|nr:cytochrome c biogenesis protein CcsA [Armatimonadota bacterium]
MSYCRRLGALVIGLLLMASPVLADDAAAGLEGFDLSEVRLLAIQQGGRLKPLDTFCREAVRLITGKEQFQGSDPVAVVLRWWSSDEAALAEPNVEIRNLALKRQLGLPEEKRWFSHRELSGNPALKELQEAIHAKHRTEEELSGTEDEASEVLVKMQLLKMIADGAALTILPNPGGLEHPWGDLTLLRNPQIASAMAPVGQAVKQLEQAVVSSQPEEFSRAAASLRDQLASMGPYPATGDLARETHFNQFHAFRKAWILYLAGFLCLFFADPRKRGTLYWIGLSIACFGFALHAYGFYLRCVIAGRPPVTNMYESVIWVGFGAVLFSLIFEFIYHARNYLLASTAGAVVCLILADTLPAVLDPSIKPLTPVLRNNFWLTIHVLTITLGYAAFLMSLGLGHMVVWKHITGPVAKDDPGADVVLKARKAELKSLTTALYKALQVGVLLLAAGTILGGVWANYSWGRFWGWDPKEVWALIALLGYLAILHARYAGWVGNYGMGAWSIVAFQGVLMAWYGVNFVLGAGLHSYGFGDGGNQWVYAYVGLEMLFVALASVRYRKLRGG